MSWAAPGTGERSVPAVIEKDVKPNFFQRSVQRIAATALGAKVFIHTAHHVDRVVLRVSGGRTTAVGLTAGLPVLTLTTIGAKSGQLRSVPLVGIPDGDKLVLIASNFGQAHYPAWYHNLKKHPQATVTLNGRTGDYIAREASGEEYERYWERAVSLYGGYAAYKTRTGRRAIPIMVLTPEPATAGRAPAANAVQT
jgi:deazaflavin-dependent oxidoreductase (nitroreductase family)